jgi:predicted amidohydrolase
MRVAVVQMTSTDEVASNLAAAEKWVAQAAELGAELVALPENFAYLRREGTAVPCAQSLDGEIVGSLRNWAERHRIWLIGGTFLETIPGETRTYNTSVAISPRGRVVAVYRKIHLFDVDLSTQGGQVYRESDSVAPGTEVASFETPAGVVGLSVCYDVRFPELYRSLAARGARFLCVPAAFARETGRDHWEVLLRARAIENQCFVLAPAQCGEHPGGRLTYGRSMVVDPWGIVIARAPDRAGVVLAECHIEDQDRIRATLPALRHRRL